MELAWIQLGLVIVGVSPTMECTMPSTRMTLSRKVSSIKLAAALLVLAAMMSPAWADNGRLGNGHDRGHSSHNQRHDNRRPNSNRHNGNRYNDNRYSNYSNQRGRYQNRGHNRTVVVPGWRRPAYRVPPRSYGHRYAQPRVYYRAPVQRWQRGARYYDHGYGTTYIVNDYNNYGLRQPPRGYYWRRDNRGEFLLVAIATGIIADLILHGGR